MRVLRVVMRHQHRLPVIHPERLQAILSGRDHLVAAWFLLLRPGQAVSIDGLFKLPSRGGHTGGLLQLPLMHRRPGHHLQRPVGAVVGGAKVSPKLDMLQNLVGKLDVLIIGGGMANTFLAAQGAQLGASLQEAALHDTARDILAAAEAAGCRIVLPSDGRVAREFAAGAAHEIAALGPDTVLADDQMVLDAGDSAAADIADTIAGLATLIWNGPLGAFEIPPFDSATVTAARAAAAATNSGTLITVAGGGDTVAALNQAGVADDFTYISTAGGAFLEWMEGKTLPGVAALMQ